jgi:hypothetical protein
MTSECTRVVIATPKWERAEWTATIPNSAITKEMTLFLDFLNGTTVPEDLSALNALNYCIKLINAWSDSGINFGSNSEGCEPMGDTCVISKTITIHWTM